MKKSPFTLIEIIIVFSLISIVIGSVSFSLKSLLDRYYFNSEIDQINHLIEELQMEALTLQSDMEIHFYKDKNFWKIKTKTDEAILINQSVLLKQIQTISLNQIPQTSLKVVLFSNGQFLPKGIIGFQSCSQQKWLDLRYPIQIHFLQNYPLNGELIKIPPRLGKILD